MLTKRFFVSTQDILTLCQPFYSYNEEKSLCTQENYCVLTQKIRAPLLKLILCRPLNSKWETTQKIFGNCCVDTALF